MSSIGHAARTRPSNSSNTGLRGSGGMDFQYRHQVPEHHARSAALKSTYSNILLIQNLLLASSLIMLNIIYKNGSLITLLIVSVSGNILSSLLGFFGRSRTSTILMKLNSTVIVTLCMPSLILYLFLLASDSSRLKINALVIINSILVLIVDAFVGVYSRMMVNCWNKAKEYKSKTAKKEF